jgi:hypothetical protein
MPKEKTSKRTRKAKKAKSARPKVSLTRPQAILKALRREAASFLGSHA